MANNGGGKLHYLVLSAETEFWNQDLLEVSCVCIMYLIHKLLFVLGSLLRQAQITDFLAA